MYEKIVRGIVSSADVSIPKLRLNSRLKPVPYWNEECSAAIQQRNNARNKMNHTRLLDDCIEYRRLKAVAQRTLKNASTQFW